MIVWQEVYSSNVQEVGYDTETKEMLVKWFNNKVSAYKDVPEEMVDRASKAWSVGTFIATEIKPFYEHRYRT